MNIEQFHHVTNNYTYPPPHIGSHSTFDPPQDRPRAPYWTVPFGRNKDFVGRESILDQLLDMIPPNADEDDCQQTVISGLGGVGKTQIALEAAFRVRNKYRDCHVFWVPALNITTFENAYREIGQKLKIQTIENDQANIKLLVKTALSQSSDNWLLIIDNADDATLFGKNTELSSLSDFLPFNLKGSILFTTRNVEVCQKLDVRKENVIHLTEMNQSEATNMLQKGLNPHQMGDPQSLESLLEFLTNLPLAIKQASAYMIKTGMAISRYLEYCRSSDEHLIQLLSKNFDDRARYETSQNPIATTWMISFNAISRDNPLAVNYLQFMAFLAEKDIPKNILPPSHDELNVYEAIGTLKSYGFIIERERGDAYDMHRLVRLVMQNWMTRNKGELQTFITTLMRRLDVVIPYPKFSNKDICARYLPHAIMALKFQDHTLDQLLRSRILQKAAVSLYYLGKFTDAKHMNQQAVDLHVGLLGDEHPDTFTIINFSLMIATCDGQGVEWEQISRKVVELRRRVVGAEHPDTLMGMHSLSYAFLKQGRYKEAEQMAREVLELRKRVSGAKHPNTLDSMYTLSVALSKLGLYKEAEQMGQQTLQLHLEVAGAENPKTLRSMYNLSTIFYGQGRYKEAEQMSRQLLELQEKVLGVEHPDALRSMYSLSISLYKQCRYKEAEQISRQLLELQEKVLGTEHPDALASSNLLSIILCKQDRHKEDDKWTPTTPSGNEQHTNILK
ncbi:hypothetical protein CFAM422_012261 [Trichoderma lentiforme]|uniref:NB-ARC domain-containing protein n=1 Tax=Trichoderma lentiforme TaxID=1567552 RepID=A0A9P5C7X4_9HYPO|nr:hypothetical protein CFAM422_012261 [Trichoderma lentiforme]